MTEELICNLCGKTIKADGEEIDHVVLKHVFAFYKWSFKHKKIFKVATKEDRGEIIASFYKPKDLRDK